MKHKLSSEEIGTLLAMLWIFGCFAWWLYDVWQHS